MSRKINENRIFNPNYRPHVAQQTEENFYSRRNGDFTSDCELQRSYGVKQRFRKYK
jgi:hypothetical protein